MMEAEWLTEPRVPTDPMTVLEMADHIAGVGSERKLRLFAHACCRRIEHLLVDPRSRSALAALARYADGECDQAELGAHWSGAHAAKQAIEEPLCRDGCLHSTAESIAGASRTPHYETATATAAATAALVATGSVAYSHAQRRSDSESAESKEAAVQARLLRDIFGNPFRPVPSDPSWLTSTVVALATGIYREKAFDRMPILADALQDAGCDNSEVLEHCRSTGPHVRGCWVLDHVFGRE